VKPLQDINIKVQIRDKYGRELTYPVCETSKALLQLTGRKTWTRDNLSILVEAGITIEYVLKSLDMETL